MSDFQQNKQLILDYYEALDNAPLNEISGVLKRYTQPEYHWRGMHPFYEKFDSDEVAREFWVPLRESLTPLQRRMDLFIAGENYIDDIGGEWVCSMGHLMGLFDKNWLGIPSTGKMVFLRYCEFHRIVDAKIAETALFIDILGVVKQAGIEPLPPQTGAFLVTPGPRNHAGLLLSAQDPEEGDKTLALINRMCQDLVDSGLESPQDELHKTWHDDMIWWGPAGIGATYTCERYQKQHQGPFGEGLDNIQFNGHVARFAEGEFGAWFGWPNLSMTASGGFLGLTRSEKQVHMRVVDIYWRDGDKLAENWIFIDILYFLYQQGVDVLARLRDINRT